MPGGLYLNVTHCHVRTPQVVPLAERKREAPVGREDKSTNVTPPSTGEKICERRPKSGEHIPHLRQQIST